MKKKIAAAKELGSSIDQEKQTQLDSLLEKLKQSQRKISHYKRKRFRSTKNQLILIKNYLKNIKFSSVQAFPSEIIEKIKSYLSKYFESENGDVKALAFEGLGLLMLLKRDEFLNNLESVLKVID